MACSPVETAPAPYHKQTFFPSSFPRPLVQTRLQSSWRHHVKVRDKSTYWCIRSAIFQVRGKRNYFASYLLNRNLLCKRSDIYLAFITGSTQQLKCCHLRDTWPARIGKVSNALYNGHKNAHLRKGQVTNIPHLKYVMGGYDRWNQWTSIRNCGIWHNWFHNSWPMRSCHDNCNNA